MGKNVLQKIKVIGFLITVLLLSSCYAHREGHSAGTEGPGEIPDLAVPPDRLLREALEEKKSGNTGEAIGRLILLRENYPGTSWANDASFLLGVHSLEAGVSVEGTDAAAFLDEARIEEIADYVRFYLAEAYTLKGENLEAVRAYDALLDDYPDSTLRPEALWRKTALLREAGDAAGAANAVHSFLDAYPGHHLYPDALLKAGLISTELGDASEGAMLLRKLLVEHPGHRAAKEGEATLLPGLREKGFFPELTPQERLLRGNAFFKLARFREAADEFSVAVEKGGSRYDEGARNLARSLMRLKRYGSAKEVLEGSLNSPEAVRRPQTLALLLEAAFHLNEEKLFLRTERELSEKFPSRAEREAALLLAGKFFEKKGDGDAARAYYGRVAKEFRGGWAAEEALWRLGWIEYEKERYGEAIEVFKDLASIAKDAKKALYWTGRTMDRLGRVPEALSAYAGVCIEYEPDYYCQMALERKGVLLEAPAGTGPGVLEKSPSDTVESKNPLEAATVSDPHYARAMKLKALGLHKHAARELEAVGGHDRSSMLIVAKTFYEIGDFHRAMKAYFKAGGGGLADPELKKIAFPPGIVDFIKTASIPGSADPLLVAAVMREESHFNPRARSSAGALGLMQIMPATGEFLLKEVESSAEGEADLLDPELNTRLGAFYLGRLARRFGGNPVLTIAGYNAGPAAAARWAEKKGSLASEADEFIEGIPFNETREYTKKVIRSYTEYLRLSGQNPWERFSRPIAGEELF